MWKAPGDLKHLAQNWQWGIEVDGFELALFSKGAAPSVTVEEADFDSAGSLYTMPTAARVTWDPITFEKGILADGSDDEALYWLFTTFNVLEQTGWVPADYKRDIDVINFARTGQAFRRWRLHHSWIKSLKYTDLDGSSNDITFEQIEIRYHYATIVDPEGHSSRPIYNEKPNQIDIIAGRSRGVLANIVGINY